MLSLVLACHYRPWSRADELVGGLHCGMTVEEIENYAREFGGVVALKRSASNAPLVTLEHKGTHVNCWGEQGRLRAIQISWISAPAVAQVSPRRDLCSGEVMADVYLTGSEGWAGATVLLDGKEVGSLVDGLKLELKAGSHSVDVRRQDGRAFSRTLRVDKEGPGRIDLIVR
jgi:hypothetical protein